MFGLVAYRGFWKTELPKKRSYLFLVVSLQLNDSVLHGAAASKPFLEAPADFLYIDALVKTLDECYFFSVSPRLDVHFYVLFAFGDFLKHICL